MASLDRDALSASLRRLGSDGPGSTLHESLDRLVDDVATLFRCTGAGLMVVDDGGDLRYVAASNGHARVLEVAQEEHASGPCVDALLQDRVVITDDVTTDPRWPELTPRLAPTDVRAVMGLPVRVGGTAIGSLDVYHAESHRWEDIESDALSRVNEVAERMIDSALQSHRNEELVGQLEQALESRVVVERAIGWLMARQGGDARSAFQAMRRVARSERRRVQDVAEDVLEGRLEPPVD